MDKEEIRRRATMENALDEETLSMRDLAGRRDLTGDATGEITLNFTDSAKSQKTSLKTSKKR